MAFAPGTTEAVLQASTTLHNSFNSPQVPLDSSDLKKKLARATINLALLCGRTTETVEDVPGPVRQTRSGARHVPEPLHELAEVVALERAADHVLDAMVRVLLEGGEHRQKTLRRR